MEDGGHKPDYPMNIEAESFFKSHFEFRVIFGGFMNYIWKVFEHLNISEDMSNVCVWSLYELLYQLFIPVLGYEKTFV